MPILNKCLMVLLWSYVIMAASLLIVGFFIDHWRS